MMTKFDYIIGIDPDVNLSGYAELNCNTEQVHLESMSFPMLIEKVLQAQKKYKDYKLLIVVELDRNTKYNWHLATKDNKFVAKAKGVAQGRNQQMAICIAELLSRLGLEVIERPPLKKCWAGKDKKITTDELFRIAGLSFNKKRTNQEERDACLLALYYSFIQLRLLNKKQI